MTIKMQVDDNTVCWLSFLTFFAIFNEKKKDGQKRRRLLKEAV